MFKTAVITGGTGWIGSTFESFLKDNYKEVIIYKTGRRCKLERTPAGEIALFHFAFPTKDKTAFMSLAEYHDSVLNLRQNVIKLIEKIKPTKMVYVSSGAVYKLGTNEFVEALEEDPYGFLKLEEEKIFTKIAQQNGIKLIIPRIFALAGGFINKIELYLLSNFIKQAIEIGEIKINAKSRVFRSYIHILDVFEICLRFFTSSLKSPCIFDTMGEEILELNDVAFYIAKALNLNIKITREFIIDAKENRYFAQNDSCKKIIDTLQIKTIRNFEKCILDTSNNLI